MVYEFLVAGGIFLGGFYSYSKLYEETRPIVEGKIIDAHFTNDDDSMVKVKTENGDLDLIIDTKKFEYGPLINFGCGFDYKGRADELAYLLSVGDWVKAKVDEKQGLERRVYELLNVYLEPSRERKVMLITDFLYNLISLRKKINKPKST